MERKCQHVLKHDMPQTPRVSSKVVDYYMKFGTRDLKKFMRLYSPESDSSQDDQKAEIVNKTILYQQNVDREMECSRSNERLKYLEAKPSLGYRKEMSQSMHNVGVIKAMSILDKDLETSKSRIIHSKLAQTPESVAKVHKPLKWDSLSDVAYDQLTSNISNSRASKNASERISTVSFIINRQNAQPLPSSTLMDVGVGSGMIPNVHKIISQGTCVTDKQRIDNFSQTTLLRAPQLIDKEIQVNLSPSTSVPEAIETPSSFEYIKFDPTKSYASSNGQKKKHGFFANLTDVVPRKVHMEKSVQHSNSISNIQKLQIKFLDNLEGSEENICHSSTKISSNNFSLLHYAPELDLGVQLICSLINRKNITQIQKKELVCEIIKHIKRLSGGSDFAWQNNIQPTSGDDNFLEPRSINVNSVTEILQRAKTANIVSPNNTVLAGSGQIRTTQSAVPSIQTRRIIFTNPEYESASQSQDSTETTENQQLISSCVYEPSRASKIRKQVPANLHKKSDMLKVPPSTKQMASISKSTSIIITKESNDLSLNICNYNGKNTGKTEKGYNELSKNVGENNLWKLPPLSTKIKSLSQVLKSEKKGDIYSNLHVDLAQPTMRECLNPMTKSEGEYERKQRNERLSWIENEIRGLQRLKRLLLYQDSSPVESNTTQSCIQDRIKRRVVIETQPQSKNLYYSVDTESHEKGETKTYKSPEIIEKNKIQDIEVVIDESIGDVVNLNNNLKRTKGRRKETQLIYENPSDVMTATEQLSVIPRFRSIRKGIIVTEEQLLGDDVDDNHGKTKHPEKIGSPTLTCKIKDNNDTLQDLILQRKQNFIELHKNKRQSHYETWKQRQKERGQYELPSVQRVTDSPLPSSASQKSSDLREEALSTTASRLTHVIYTSAAMHASSQQVRRNLQQDAVTASTTTTSSLSLFCVSSDMSVPSGSENSSSTPTTTHQYDDVADTGVGIQTREAMLRSYPIYDLQRCKNLHAKRIGCTLRVCKTCLSTSRAQVKSKGIAYVIEFNDDEKPDDGNKDQAPPDKCSNMNKSLPKTTTTYLTENIKLFHKDRKAQRVTLQEHLENCLPKFLRHTKKREDLLKARQAVRVERRRQLKEIIDNASFTSLEKHIKLLPPAPIENLRIVNTKQMKAWTDKRFAKLPEVVEKRRRVREERDRRNSRILRHLFNQGLQQRVLDRRISLSHSRTVV